MKNKFNNIFYFNRHRARFEQEKVYAGKFLYWSYNTRWGAAITNLLIRHRWVSWFYGWWNNQRWSGRKIRHFVEIMNVNMEESLRPIEGFHSFNDFFTRKINLSDRPIVRNLGTCIAPVDGKVLAYCLIQKHENIRIKRHRFNLCNFLADEELGEQFSEGSVVICRLNLTDYHHFHFPDSGVAERAKAISGKYYTGGPYSLRQLIPFYSENYRMLTMFNSEHFGRMAIVEVGAFIVGSIRQEYQVGIPVEKGSYKGYFELGGSTVVLLFQKGVIELDSDLLSNTQKEIETYVRMGQSIGKRSQK